MGVMQSTFRLFGGLQGVRVKISQGSYRVYDVSLL